MITHNNEKYEVAEFATSLKFEKCFMKIRIYNMEDEFLRELSYGYAESDFFLSQSSMDSTNPVDLCYNKLREELGI